MRKNEPSWFERNGVAEPETIAHGITDEQLEAKFRELTANTVHGSWIQSGNTITCRRCLLPHSSPIPVNYLLKGTDDKGLPILEKLGKH